MSQLHTENHLVSRIGWLRAAILGANDGILSTASLIMGVASASTETTQIMIAGIAGIVAGAMSMAAGEYVSVSSQSDTEKADIARERKELETQPEAELDELMQAYTDRGLTPELAQQVAIQLTSRNALEAHARDELGIVEHMEARPIQAALTSAATFSIGAALPLLIAAIAPPSILPYAVAISSLLLLAFLGAIGAKAGGASVLKATVRVTFWGALAMAITAGIGALVGRTI
jgi:VIT1/CCC1 family predicted Fe2+/Mn2+ transporter